MTPYYDSLLPRSISGPGLDRALALGWYRSQQGMFTCSHIDLGGIHRVHWLRYRLHEIVPRPSHTRILKKNADFKVIIEDLDPTFIRPDHIALHALYRNSIDFDGARSITSCLFGEADTRTNIYTTKCISVFDGDTLIAGGYFDLGLQAAASILHFFHPRYEKFSLGKFLMLVTLDHLREGHFTLYYPGYVVQGLPKMDYKLFLGRQVAQYFDPDVLEWKYFDERILQGTDDPLGSLMES